MGSTTLRIDTSSLTDSSLALSSSYVSDALTSATAPRTRGRARTLSQAVLPSFRSSSVAGGEKSPTFASHSPAPRTQKKPQKARDESRKLLAHILGELHNRPRAPPLFDMFQTDGMEKEVKGIGAMVQSVRGAVAFKASKQEHHSSRSLSFAEAGSDEDEVTESAFSTNITFDLMDQLKNVLIISQAQGWQIFDDGTIKFESFQPRNSYEKSASSFRFRRSSFQSNGRSRSSSPNPGNPQAPELLSHCISVLASVVTEDCRFQFSSPKLKRPPNALQALTLDIAQFLVHMHRMQPKILCEIGFAVIPAFSSFRVEMHSRLLAFFEEGILRGMLDDLKISQGASVSLTAPSYHEINPGSDSLPQPIVAIQVDEAQDDSDPFADRHGGWSQWSSEGSIMGANFTSAKAPSQPHAVYYLSSIVPPLLAAVLDNVDLLSPVLPKIHRAYKLFQLIVDTKMDAYLDILEVLAYHTDRARHSAISLLSTFWPKALGHVVVGKPIPTFSYTETLQRLGMIKPWQYKEHPYVHQFVPWRFIPPPFPAVFEGMSISDCRSCSKRINGFGLLCPFCMCTVHFDCYDAPEGSFLSHYPMENDPNIEKIAVHRFSHILSSRGDIRPEVAKKHQHAFRLVNIFTLSLCLICHLPLWGCITQGLRCASCKHFVHTACLKNGELPRCRDVTPDLRCIRIEWDLLRESFAEYYHHLLIPEEELGRWNQEEISVLWSTLCTQLQLLRNGIVSGSIVIVQTKPKTDAAKESGIDDFELHYFEKLYRAYLDSGRLSISPALKDYLQETKQPEHNHSIMFDWPTLVFITSVIKTPLLPTQPGNGFGKDLLNVNQPDESKNASSENASFHPFENVPLMHIRDALGLEFHLYHDSAACLMLSHLHHLGFLECLDMPLELFRTPDRPTHIRCSFPIPLGIDLSSDVETLVVAVEVCLKDLDVSVNETGFLLLVRRLWPSGMASEYALTRLTRTVLAWILTEDLSLMTILRDFVARGRSLPGVPSNLDTHAWPNSLNLRSVPSSSVNNGGDYVACRKVLLTRYASRWLLALHDQDITLYSKLLYEIMADLASESDRPDALSNFLDPGISEHHRKVRKAAWADRLLRFILKLCQSSIAFSAVDDILLHFLNAVSDLASHCQAIPTLSRLFNREVDDSIRFTMIADVTMGSIEQTGTPFLDPWRVVIDAASSDEESLNKAIKWLCLFSSSGVDIPIATFLRISALARDLGLTFEDHSVLAEAALLSTWMKSLGKQDLQAMVSELHTRHAAWIRGQLQRKENIFSIHRFIRQSLAICLLLYGCERAHLLTIGMIEEIEIKHLPSRRKSAKSASTLTDPIIVDVDLIGALSLYVDEAADDICCLIAKFLSTFVTEAALLEPYEIDNFIMRNSYFLTSCAWRFYDINAPELNALRTALLLRILVVDVQPFETLLRERFDLNNSWEIRLQSVTQLFRIILDVTSPSFNVEGRQWRSSVTDVFYHYFTSIWADDREEIRLATDTSSQTLQPSHLEAITLCWNESLVKAPIADRMKLVSFLLQLRPHFPTWRVLSWEVIIETFLDEEFAQRNGDDEDGPASAHLSMYGISAKASHPTRRAFADDPDLAVLHSSLILLSLQMIAEGIPIDVFSLLKIKLHLANLLGYPDAQLVPAPSGHSFHIECGQLGEIAELTLPCIDGLMALLDAFHHLDIPPSAMTGSEDDEPSKLLVGSIFVDVVLSLFNQIDDFATLPFLTAKALLQSLTIIVYKHDLESRPLHHLRDNLRKAIRKATDLLLLDISYELRQLALSVCQAYLKRWPFYASNILIYQMQSVIRLVSSLYSNGEDILVAQATSFLESTLTQYSSSGLFYQLCKRDQDPEFFVVIRYIMVANARTHVSQGNLWEAVLRDTFNQILSQPNDPAQQTVVENIKNYIDVVHRDGYTSDLMQFVGRCLAATIRNAGEMTSEEFDPNPLLAIAAILVQHNKAQSRDFMGYTETLLRVALVRFNVNSHHLTRLLQVTSALYRRPTENDSADSMKAVPRSSIALAIIDILSDALRGKARVTTSTLTSMIKALPVTTNATSEPTYLSTEDLLRLAKDGFYFLQSLQSSDVQIPRDFTSSLAVASLVLRAADYDVGFFMRQLDDQISDRTGKSTLTVRAWNLLALCAIQSTSTRSARTLFMHLSSFTGAYYTSLRMTAQTTGLPPDVSAADVNRAYIAIKLWLLLARKCFEESTVSQIENSAVFTKVDNVDEDINTRMVWNELWPPFEKLVTLSESDAEAGEISSTATLIWSSVADLFLFLRQMRSVIALESSSHIATLNRVRVLGRGESATGKVSRAVHSMSEPPLDVSLEMLTSQAAHDIMAAEKLHALGIKREVGRTIPDRNRREMRLGSG